MVRRPSDEPRAQAQRRAQQKYRLSAQGAWIINTEAFGVRPIDLVARAPDRLREFATLNEAAQFEFECYDARQHDKDKCKIRSLHVVRISFTYNIRSLVKIVFSSLPAASSKLPYTDALAKMVTL